MNPKPQLTQQSLSCGQRLRDLQLNRMAVDHCLSRVPNAGPRNTPSSQPASSSLPSRRPDYYHLCDSPLPSLPSRALLALQDLGRLQHARGRNFSEGLKEGLHVRFGVWGIRIHCICPFPTNSSSCRPSTVKVWRFWHWCCPPRSPPNIVAREKPADLESLRSSGLWVVTFCAPLPNPGRKLSDKVR